MADRSIILDVVERRRGDALKAEAAELDRLADKAEVSGRSMRQMGGESAALSKRIEEQTVKVRALASEIERSGGTDKSLFKQFAQAERDLGKLSKVNDALKDAGTKAGSSFSASFVDAVEAGAQGIRGPLIAVAAVAAPILATMIGAAVAGSVTGAVGVGGIVGGVAAASRDPAVATAAGDLKDTLVSEFEDVGAEFVKPALQGIRVLKEDVRDLDLVHLFAPVAPYVERLAEGLGDTVKALEPGLSRALESAGPAIDALAEGLPEIGKAIGDVMAEFAESPGAVEGLTMALDLTATVIRVVGNDLTWLSDRFDDVLGVGIHMAEGVSAVMSYLPPGWLGLDDVMDDNIEHWKSWQRAGDEATTHAAVMFRITETGIEVTDRWGQSLANGIAHMRDYAVEGQIMTATAQQMAVALDQSATSIRDFHSAELEASNASLAFKNDILDLKQAVKDHGASLSDNTKVGIENQQQLLKLATEAGRTRDANIAAGMSVDVANAKYRQQITDLEQLAIKLGMSKTKVDDLIGGLKSVPRHITTEYLLKYTTQGTPFGEHSGVRIDEIGHRAGGGSVDAGQPYIVGEKRPELFVPSENGYIMPYVPTGSTSSGAAGGGGGVQTAPINLNGGGLADLVWMWIQREVQNQYGGDVVAAFGGRR